MEIKICGMTNIEDVKAALDMGADYIGFVLYPLSLRAIGLPALSSLLSSLNAECRTVGVFVNEKRAFIEKVASECGLYAVQLHGDEQPGEYQGLATQVWRAVRTRKGGFDPDPGIWPESERFVVDAAVPGCYGGTGQSADWNAAGKLARQYRIMLAGGLSPDNVEQAILKVRPAGVDAVSGLESVPGRKDLKRMKMFFDAVAKVE